MRGTRVGTCPPLVSETKSRVNGNVLGEPVQTRANGRCPSGQEPPISGLEGVRRYSSVGGSLKPSQVGSMRRLSAPASTSPLTVPFRQCVESPVAARSGRGLIREAPARPHCPAVSSDHRFDRVRRADYPQRIHGMPGTDCSPQGLPAMCVCRMLAGTTVRSIEAIRSFALAWRGRCGPASRRMFHATSGPEWCCRRGPKTPPTSAKVAATAMRSMGTVLGPVQAIPRPGGRGPRRSRRFLAQCRTPDQQAFGRATGGHGDVLRTRGTHCRQSLGRVNLERLLVPRALDIRDRDCLQVPEVPDTRADHPTSPVIVSPKARELSLRELLLGLGRFIRRRCHEPDESTRLTHDGLCIHGQSPWGRVNTTWCLRDADAFRIVVIVNDPSVQPTGSAGGSALHGEDNRASGLPVDRGRYSFIA
jgi:hypothetical protein